VWAAGSAGEKNTSIVRDVTQLLSEQERSDIVNLCGRCLYHTLQTCVRAHGTGETTFVGKCCHAKNRTLRQNITSNFLKADLRGCGGSD
jgi:hypothetical protein